MQLFLNIFCTAISYQFFLQDIHICMVSFGAFQLSNLGPHLQTPQMVVHYILQFMHCVETSSSSSCLLSTLILWQVYHCRVFVILHFYFKIAIFLTGKCINVERCYLSYPVHICLIYITAKDLISPY